MNTLLFRAIAMSLWLSGLGSSLAYAGITSSPQLPTGSMVRTIADQEMTVSNGYGYANLRERPSTSSKLLAQLAQGTKVVVIEKVSGGIWLHVKAGDKVGYIKAALLK